MNLHTFTLLLLLFSFQSYAHEPSIVAENLNGPFSVHTDYLGNHWVTEVGSGNNDGGITLVRPHGEKIPIITGLPSYFNPNNEEVTGAWHSLQLPNKQLAIVIGEGPTTQFGRILIFDLRRFEIGRAAPLTLSKAIQSIDVSTYVLSLEGVTASNPYSVARDWNGNWYVADAGANKVIKISKDGKKRSVFVEMPAFPNPLPFGPPVVDQVPTKIISKGHDSFFLAQLTGFPFTEGTAKIYSVNNQGKLFEYATGLTALVDMTLDKKTGDLYALQFATFGFDPAPGFTPHTSKITKISPKDKSTTISAEGFGPSTGISINSKGDLFVTELFSGRLLKMERPRPVHSLQGKTTDLAASSRTYAAHKKMVLTSYPNPAVDQILLEWEEERPSSIDATLELVDISGKVVLRQAIDGSNRQQMLRLDDVESGMYVVQWRHAFGVATKKIVVKR